MIYLYFEKHASIIFLRRRGVFSHYVWDSVEELITIILKHKKLFSLKENEINYLNNKINNSSWLKNAYAFIDKEINELICVHIQNSVCYDECQTSLFYELLVYIEYRFRYHKYEKKIDNNNCLNLDDVDSYSNEDIAEAVSYILKLINKCKENNKVYHKFLWMDDNYILSEELNKILLLSLKKKKIIDCEIKNDYFDYIVKPASFNIKTSSSYAMEYKDDDGSGCSHTNLILFDLIMLFNTKLPLLLHDSNLSSDIDLTKMKVLINLYLKSKKQIFVALSNCDRYDDETKNLIEKNQVIELGVKENRLFGNNVE